LIFDFFSVILLKYYLFCEIYILLMHSKHEILRLLRYRMCLIRLKNIGFEYVYSYYLGEEIGVSAEQIRKDLSKFGIKGKKKIRLSY